MHTGFCKKRINNKDVYCERNNSRQQSAYRTVDGNKEIVCRDIRYRANHRIEQRILKEALIHDEQTFP